MIDIIKITYPIVIGVGRSYFEYSDYFNKNHGKTPKDNLSKL